MCTAQQRFQPGGFRHRHATDVEIVDQSADPFQRRISIQPEARQQHLEGDFGPDVGELGTVEVEANRALGAILGALKPQEFRATGR